MLLWTIITFIFPPKINVLYVLPYESFELTPSARFGPILLTLFSIERTQIILRPRSEVREFDARARARGRGQFEFLLWHRKILSEVYEDKKVP